MVIILIYKKYGSYLVYEDGSCCSLYFNKFLKPYEKEGGYLEYRLYENGQVEAIRVHRLVGKLFLPLPENWKELQINHKDGNKKNNHYSNLEWCTSYENNKHARNNSLNNITESNHKRWQNKEWAEQTAKRISQNCNNKHTHNPRFKYWIEDEEGKNYTRTELKELLGFCQSYTDIIIKKASEGIVHPSLEKRKKRVINTKE